MSEGVGQFVSFIAKHMCFGDMAMIVHMTHMSAFHIL